MTPNSHSLVACACALASLATAGCLCPPCPGKAAAAGPEAAGAAPAAPVAVGSRMVVWDGDEVGTGAQPWESCDQKPTCQSKVTVEEGAGINGSKAVKFHGEGAGWIGMGWNLFGWYPPNAGADLGPYTQLTFQIRVDAKSDGAVPNIGYVAVLLGCSGNKFDSADAPIERFAKNYIDGKWHKVVIPISTFLKGKGAKFDMHSFWEFRLSNWSGTSRKFDIYIDDIAAEKL
jgi:hypothetical protein